MHSHVLVYGLDDVSELKGNSRLGERNMSLIRGFRDFYSPISSDLRLENFPIYGARIQHIQQKMEEWRPRSIRELYIRPYKDPLAYYAFWFAAFIGVVGVLSLGATIAQTVASFK